LYPVHWIIRSSISSGLDPEKGEEGGEQGDKQKWMLLVYMQLGGGRKEGEGVKTKMDVRA